MDSKYLVWAIVIGVGALFGAFLTLTVVLRLIVGLVILAFVGGFGAAFLQLIRPEWLLLLMGVLPVAGPLFVSAAVSNALVGLMKKTGTKPRIRRDKG